MKNQGKNQHRFKDNPKELEFALKWEKLNTNYNGELDGLRTIDYILAENPNQPKGEVTERDRMVAATVIQWLGSPCGQTFLQEENIEKIPEQYEPVLAIIYQNIASKIVTWKEVVYHDGKKWKAFKNSRTFENNEQVQKWKYADKCFLN